MNQSLSHTQPLNLSADYACAAITALKPSWQPGDSARLNLKPNKAAASSSSALPKTSSSSSTQGVSGGTPVKVPAAAAAAATVNGNGHSAAATANGHADAASAWKVSLDDLAENDIAEVRNFTAAPRL
jgi:hypothetical protein